MLMPRKQNYTCLTQKSTLEVEKLQNKKHQHLTNMQNLPQGDEHIDLGGYQGGDTNPRIKWTREEIKPTGKKKWVYIPTKQITYDKKNLKQA